MQLKNELSQAILIDNKTYVDGNTGAPPAEIFVSRLGDDAVLMGAVLQAMRCVTAQKDSSG